MAGATISWGFYFGWYSLIKKYMTKDDQGKLSAVQHLTASAEAGQSSQSIFNCILTCYRRFDCSDGKPYLGSKDSYVYN